MNRLISTDLKQNIGEQVFLRGWLYKKRVLGGMTFLILRDRGGLTQILDEKSEEVTKLAGLQNGTVLSVTGIVVEDERAPGGVEIHEPKITIEVPVEFVAPVEIDKSLDHTPDNLDVLFENRVVGLRNVKEGAIFKIQAAVKNAVREFLKKEEFVEFNSPKLLPGSTEGGAEVFKLDYFGKEATLAQSAQFYKQIMVGVYERAFEINPTYRAELSATTRHMTEFIHIDAELGFVNFEELLQLTGNLLSYVVEKVWEESREDLDKWQVVKPIVASPIPVIPLHEVHEKYSAATGTNTIGEKDLRPDEEKWICEYASKNLDSEAVMVTCWPSSEMKFYHRAKIEEPQYSERFDLLFRGVEIATGSMREHRYDVLVDQLKKLVNADTDHPGFKYYLQAFKYGMPPHGGFGMGLERLTQKIVGLKNVKEATLFPRDINRLAP